MYYVILKHPYKSGPNRPIKQNKMQITLFVKHFSYSSTLIAEYFMIKKYTYLKSIL